MLQENGVGERHPAWKAHTTPPAPLGVPDITPQKAPQEEAAQGLIIPNSKNLRARTCSSKALDEVGQNVGSIQRRARASPKLRWDADLILTWFCSQLSINQPAATLLVCCSSQGVCWSIVVWHHRCLPTRDRNETKTATQAKVRVKLTQYGAVLLYYTRRLSDLGP